MADDIEAQDGLDEDGVARYPQPRHGGGPQHREHRRERGPRARPTASGSSRRVGGLSGFSGAERLEQEIAEPRHLAHQKHGDEQRPKVGPIPAPPPRLYPRATARTSAPDHGLRPSSP